MADCASNLLRSSGAALEVVERWAFPAVEAQVERQMWAGAVTHCAGGLPSNCGCRSRRRCYRRHWHWHHWAGLLLVGFPCSRRCGRIVLIVSLGCPRLAPSTRRGAPEPKEGNACSDHAGGDHRQPSITPSCALADSRTCEAVCHRTQYRPRDRPCQNVGLSQQRPRMDTSFAVESMFKSVL